MAIRLQQNWCHQEERDLQLLAGSRYLGKKMESSILPFQIDIERDGVLSELQVDGLEALSIQAARTAILAVSSLAKINEVDHLGGGLDLIEPLLLTLALVDYEKKDFTIEHAHTSIGYYAALAALGFLKKEDVIHQFRRSLDIPGHVSWVPGGTQLNGGRLGVMIPTAVGQVLGRKAYYGSEAFSICHCGDASWISGQALNGFNAADLHEAPITFVMHRNGIQLSGATSSILNKDPRPIVEAMGITVLEIESLHDIKTLYGAYREAWKLAVEGRPSMIYPVGIRSDEKRTIDLTFYGEKYGILGETRAKAVKNDVDMETPIWIPGALMGYRDVESMLDCLFLVNGLPGGKGHHDGHMKGRNAEDVLAGKLLQMKKRHAKALDALRAQLPQAVETCARPERGTKNLVLPADVIRELKVPEGGAMASARAGTEAAYQAIAKAYPEQCFVVSCDLDASTKLLKAREELPANRQFEMSIEEQAAAMMANGLAMAVREPQLVVFSTFSAFFAGIAREGFEMWRYQRNLNGSNEGLNVVMHLSHVGANTGRDHFSGWDLDWINLALSYLSYLHRFYAPADARSACRAVLDMAAHYGGHIIGIPRDNLPVLLRQDSNEALWEDLDAEWENITVYRLYSGARKAIITIGAPSYLAGEAAAALYEKGIPVDVYIINALPISLDELSDLLRVYPGGVVTVEDGMISSGKTCLQGLAGFVANAANALGIPIDYIGITDPRVAPADGYAEVWEHFGITADAISEAVETLS